MIRKEIGKFFVCISKAESNSVMLFPINKAFPSFSFIQAAIGQCGSEQVVPGRMIKSVLPLEAASDF